ARWFESLLCGEQLDHDRPAGDHEPHGPGERNARDCRQAGEKERQIAVSFELRACWHHARGYSELVAESSVLLYGQNRICEPAQWIFEWPGQTCRAEAEISH